MLKTSRNLKSGLMLILAFILICSTLVFMLGVPALAAENDTSEADQTESDNDGSGDSSETTPDDGATETDEATETTDGENNNDKSEENTGSGEDSSDENLTETDTSEKEKSAFRKWWDSYNQIIGYIVAGLILIAIVITIALWIPKDEKKSRLKVKGKTK